MNPIKLLPLFLKISLPLILLDQISKWWIVLTFNQPDIIVKGERFVDTQGIQQITVVEDFFNIIRVHNQGVAFGFGNGSAWAPVVFLFVPLIALFLVPLLWKKNIFEGVAKWSAPLLLAGIIGNLIDRLFQGFWLRGPEQLSFFERLGHGYVVDFLDIQVPFTNGYHWPSFNVADSCICIAATLLFLSAFKPEKKPEQPEN
ncbi:MAG: signal peptidase II [Rubritalea sp.]|jgi:signal peptidase II|tara:strand:+ start:6050 stop:6652 length:603 start_codon:yes stop_codon:yes gene_type:complete